MRRTILVIEDDAALREMSTMALAKEGHRVLAASSVEEARNLLESSTVDLVVSDIYLGDTTAIDLLRSIPAAELPRVILMTAHGTVETAAAARQAGVFDYLAKPFTLETLLDRVAAALREHRPLEAPVEPGPASMIVGNHPSIVEVYKAIARVAVLPVPVLLRGETGTGKELAARALHRFGRHPGGPFVAVNCGAIPEGLVESELFGHRKGAFTGAVSDRRGAVEQAHGGTLLLDEVGELPPPVQVKLLRFLQEGEIRPVGGERTSRPDVRVVAATHRDLRREAAAGRFREDLYYRLAAYEIVIPPLRQRATDIPALVRTFFERSTADLGIHDAEGPTGQVLEYLQGLPWPGNVRQLQNVVQRALVDLGGLADLEGVRHLARAAGAESAPDGEARESPGPAIGSDLTLEELERLHIEAVLARCGGNKTRAAAILGIERKTLYRKLERYGIESGHGEVIP